LFYSVLILTCLITAVLVGASIVHLLKTGLQSTMKRRSLFRFFVIMALFCFCFLVTIASILAVIFNLQVKKGGWAEDISQWYTCVYSWTIPTSDCPTPTTEPSLARWEAFMFSTCGTVLFICFFLLRQQTRTVWPTAFSNLYHGRPFYNDLATTTTRQGSSGSSRAGAVAVLPQAVAQALHRLFGFVLSLFNDAINRIQHCDCLLLPC